MMVVETRFRRTATITGAKTMVAETRFRRTATIAKGINDGGGNAFSPYCHHLTRNKDLCSLVSRALEKTYPKQNLDG